MATDSIRNAQGGIIAGRDVSLTALTGDVINQRSVTRIDSAQGQRTWTASFADSAARIEAAGNLDISAGRDIGNLGGVLKAGNDLRLNAGRDVNITSVETINGQVNGSRSSSQSIRQLGAEASAGRDLDISAGRDLSAVASRLDAARDAALSAGRDVTLAAAADETHSYSKTKKVTSQQDHVEQQASTLDAGGDVTVSAGENLTLKASKIGAGNEAYLVAGDKLELQAANDSDYSLYDKKDKGSFGQKKTRHDEVTDVSAVGSEIKTGGNLTLLSGGDQTYQGARLDSGNDLAIVSGGAVTFEAVKDLHQESHEKSDSNLAWQSSKGQGKTDETLRQSELIAQGNLTIKAVEGLKIDLKHIDQKTVSQTIDAMVQADPKLAWLKEAEQRGDVDWRRVKEIHDSYSYSQSGMGPATQLAVAIVVTVLTYGAASTAIGAGAASSSAFSAGAAATATTPAVAAGWANVALSAGAASLASTGAVSTINNKGNLGTALSDTFSGDSLKQAMIAGAVGGLTTGYFDDWVGTKTRFVDGKVVVDLGGVDGVSRFAANQALQNLSGAALNKATGGSASFSDALKNSLYNTFAAVGFNAVGDFGKTHKLETGGEQMVVLHALMGGLAAEARGESFAAGAAAAGLNEAVVKDLDALVSSYSPENRAALLSMSSQLVGLVATVAQDPAADAGKLETGAWVAQNATQYNHELHRNNAKSFVDGALDFCRQKPDACSSGAAQLTQQDVIAALEATAAHGEGIEKVKPEALELVNQFLNNPDLADTLQKDLFSYTESERKRLAVNDTAELAIAGLSLAQAAKAVLMGNGGALAKIASGLRQEAADGAKRAATAQKPLVTKGADVTPEVIQKALQGDPNISAQNAVSLPAVQRYVDRLLAGEVAPAIKMDGNVIIDGNHRYIAAKILGREPDVVPGILSPSKVDRTKPVIELKIDPADWGNK